MGNEQSIDARWVLGAGAMMRSGQHPRSPATMPRLVPRDLAESQPADPLLPLIKRMAARDERALAEFYDATLSKAYGLTLRTLRNAALVEEVLGDAYHQVWREAGRYDRARSGPLTWLLMICRSRALDALRARDPAVPHEDPATLVADADQPRDEDPLDLLAAMESRNAVHSALRALTLSQRQMISLAFFRGLSHQEIAEQTGIALGTVKSQIRRALGTLRAALGKGAGE